eukprot:COSAG05_NODE_368_length_10734_cov_4.853315_8_plen_198_part_00
MRPAATSCSQISPPGLATRVGSIRSIMVMRCMLRFRRLSSWRHLAERRIVGLRIAALHLRGRHAGASTSPGATSVPAFDMWGGGGSPRGSMLPTSATSRGICYRLKRWKPLEGWTLGMVQTYFLSFVFVIVFMCGIWHCRAYRMRTDVGCDAAGCSITKTYGGAVRTLRPCCCRRHSTSPLAPRLPEDARLPHLPLG